MQGMPSSICHVQEDQGDAGAFEKKVLFNSCVFGVSSTSALSVKSDHRFICLCGDFQLTVNQIVQLDHYPFPCLEDLHKLRKGYHLIELGKKSKPYLVSNMQCQV